MASIGKRGDKGHVVISRRDHPTVCKSFSLLKDAQTWAKNSELNRLAHHLFKTLGEIQEFPTNWLWAYNHDRPTWHSAVSRQNRNWHWPLNLYF